jgi:hypothetical protein
MTANLEIGSNNSETNRLINNLMQVDKEQYEQFVGANPETLLPDNLDDDCIVSTVPLEGIVAQEFVSTPEVSIKEPDTSELWTEVVKRGRKKNKTRSTYVKIGHDDRSLLEY